MSATVPYLWMDVTATVNTSLPSGGTARIRKSNSTDGLGDGVLIPLMLNYNADPGFNLNLRIGAYAPTGNHEVGRLANTGKDF